MIPKPGGKRRRLGIANRTLGGAASSSRHRAADCIRTLAVAGTEVFYAGNAFIQFRHRTALPGHYLSNNLQQACNQIEGRLCPQV